MHSAPVDPRMNPPRDPEAAPGVDESGVRWIGQSRRVVAGRPDTRFGWFRDCEGLWFVKAMDAAWAVHSSDFLHHERHMLEVLQRSGLPVPRPRKVIRSDWLVTPFAGLSLERLRHEPTSSPRALSTSERLSVWVHVLQQLNALAHQGILVVDLWAGNVLIPLTSGLHGQLRLHCPVLIDHAHTLQAGMAIHRPLWIDAAMTRLAPELRPTLRVDQMRMQEHFLRKGLPLPNSLQSAEARSDAVRSAWAAYKVPQSLQSLLDAGLIDVDRAMQWAVGCALRREDSPSGLLPCVAGVSDRLCAVDPAERFASLADAAAGLARAIGPVPWVSRASWPELNPSDWLGRTDDNQPALEKDLAVGLELPAASASPPGLGTSSADAGVGERNRRGRAWSRLAAAGLFLGAFASGAWPG